MLILITVIVMFSKRNEEWYIPTFREKEGKHIIGSLIFYFDWQQLSQLDIQISDFVTLNLDLIISEAYANAAMLIIMFLSFITLNHDALKYHGID